MQGDPWDEMEEWQSSSYDVNFRIMIKRVQMGVWQVDKLTTNTEITVLSQSPNRALTVMSWILEYATGFPHWNVPAPTKTRFPQQASETMLAFSQCMKIVDTTIPFPMLQTSLCILVTFTISWAFLV